MIILKDYDVAEASNNSAFKRFSLGAHLTEITNASDYVSKKGTPLLKFTFDVIENNELNHYFENNCKVNDDGELQWPNSGTKYLSQNDNSLLKQLVNSINSSNEEQVVVRTDEELDLSQFINKKLCCQFGLEEYYNSSNKLVTGIYIKGFYPSSEVDNIEIPPVRLIDGTEISYEEYMIKNKEIE